MKKFLEFLDNNFWIFIILIPLFSFLALFLKPGYFGVSDDIHIAWLHQMDQVVRSSKLPPRYVPDLSYGFGYPLFNFVFPLPFYLGESFHLLSFSLVDSMKIVFALSLFLSFLSMYFLLRGLTSKWISLLGATIYLYAPYRATDIYVRGAIGESLSFVFLPLVVLSFVSLIDSKGKKINFRLVGLGGLSIAGLILSHNITAYMFLPLALFLPFFTFIAFRRKKDLFFVSFAVLLGLLASSYFWVPAILDSKLMKYDTVFDYFDHFPTFKQLITPYFGYGASVPGPYDGMSFFIGLPQIVVFVLGLILFLVNLKSFSSLKLIHLLWSFFIFFYSLFMMNYRSGFLWKLIPYIAYFQFPWRFLTMTVFSSSLFVVVFEKLKLNNLFFFFSILVVLLVSLSYFKPSGYLERYDDYYLNRYVPSPQPSEEYKQTSEEYLRLPISTKVRSNQVEPVLFGSNFVVDSYNSLNALDFVAYVTVSEKDGAIINVRRYNFPGWNVKLDGGFVQTKSGEPFGQISFFVEEGKHKIEVYFSETLRNKILDFVSFFSFILLFYFLFDRKEYE